MKNNKQRDVFPAMFGLFLTVEAGTVLVSWYYPFKAVYIVSAIGLLVMGVCALFTYFLSVRQVLRQWRDRKG